MVHTDIAMQIRQNAVSKFSSFVFSLNLLIFSCLYLDIYQIGIMVLLIIIVVQKRMNVVAILVVALHRDTSRATVKDGGG